MLFLIYVISLFFIILLYYYPENNTIIRNKYNRKVVYLGTIFISIYIVWVTDINYTDRINYTKRFTYISDHTIFQSFKQLDSEPLFIVTVKFISYFTNEPILIYLFLHILFLIILFKGLNLIVNKDYSLLVFLIFINYPFYYGFTLNGIRQSFALVLLILSCGYMLKKNNMKFIITSFLAIMFHYGTIPFSIILILMNYIKVINLSLLLKVYLALSILFIFNLQPFIFTFINIDLFESYFSADNIEEFGGSNKIQFYLFNTVFLSIFLYFFKKFQVDYVYQGLLKVYIAFSNIFLLFGFIAYSNRVASYSWFIIPLLCGYIILKIRDGNLRLIIILFIMIIGLLASFPDHIIK